MPTTTTEILKQKESDVMALMGINRDVENYNAIIDGIFTINENRQKHFRDRINIKDYGITSVKLEERITAQEQDKEKPPKWLFEKVSAPKTNEYLFVKRKSYISNMIKQVEAINNTLENDSLSKMSLAIFKNEVYEIYETFLEGTQDENFLSIVNLFEDILLKNKINKDILKECIFQLKQLHKKETINYNDYKNIIKRFLDKGVDFTSIEELSNEK